MINKKKKIKKKKINQILKMIYLQRLINLKLNQKKKSPKNQIMKKIFSLLLISQKLQKKKKK